MAKGSLLRRVLGVGVLAGAAYAVWRAIEANRPAGDTDWEPQPFPFPPQPRAAEPGPSTAPTSKPPSKPTAATAPAKVAAETVVESADGACPTSHPVKAASGSKVFHVPGGQMYDRTTAARCYRDAAAAEADGLRQSKR